MHKRERLENTILGEKTDRIPIALWRHFPGDDQRAADLAAAISAFQQEWDFDFVNVLPANTYSVVDYGVQDHWTGDAEGVRHVLRPLIARSLDWTELRRLEPTRGVLGQQLETLRLLGGAFGEELPLVHTIYSPLTQAALLAGEETLIVHLRTHADRVKTGLNIITDNLLRYIETLRKMRLDGILYAITHAAYAMMSEEEYAAFGRPYDLKILAALPDHWWLNIVQVSGQSPMIGQVADYPVQVLSWHDRDSELDLAAAKIKFQGAVCGGLGRWQPMTYGMPGEVREQALNAIEQTYGRRLILSSGLPLIMTSPRSNIRMARQVVEDTARSL